jgi:penicillin-binding protein 2
VSFHPNDVARRSRAASGALFVIFAVLVGAFFRTQVLQNTRYTLQSQQNRLREVPLPAPRGIIYDRNGKVIAENLPGYSVSILSPSEEQLRTTLRQLSGTVTLTTDQIQSALRRYRREPNRPTAVLNDASFDVVSVLEEHRVEFPQLIIQSAPKRFYPDSTDVAAFIGYTGEVTETELGSQEYEGYKSGQQVGKGGIEKQYEAVLRGQEGARFVEVDAKGRVVREAGAQQDVAPGEPQPLRTNIDMDLQKFVAGIFGDSLQGGLMAMDPRTGEVLSIYSAPSYNPNRFIGGIAADYYKSLLDDPRKPLYNKAIQGLYPPGSTWKLATSVLALQGKTLAGMDEKMPEPCSGGLQYGNRYIRCWDHRGHGSLTLAGAIEKSCDVYFYQLGLKMGLARLVAGGISLGMRERSGVDLPNEKRPDFPYAKVKEYYDRKYGPRGWTAGSSVIILSIGQGENSQSVANMAKFYTALATDGQAATPEIVHGKPKRDRVFTLPDSQMLALRNALAGVVSANGTAGGSRIEGLVLAGKTGTAQNSHGDDHAWFVGFAPADNPKIVVAVMLEFGLHGSRAARIASKVIEHYLKAAPAQLLETEG